MNKQIEEMAYEIYETLMFEAEYPLSGMDCANIADLLVKRKGYRKASDVAREIFEEIDNEIKNHGITYARRKIAELKKKYTESVDEHK